MNRIAIFPRQTDIPKPQGRLLRCLLAKTRLEMLASVLPNGVSIFLADADVHVILGIAHPLGRITDGFLKRSGLRERNATGSPRIQ